jgi:hypothetical protein
MLSNSCLVRLDCASRPARVRSHFGAASNGGINRSERSRMPGLVAGHQLGGNLKTHDLHEEYRQAPNLTNFLSSAQELLNVPIAMQDTDDCERAPVDSVDNQVGKYLSEPQFLPRGKIFPAVPNTGRPGE